MLKGIGPSARGPRADEVMHAVAPHFAGRPVARDRFRNVSHRVGIGKKITGVHEPQQITRRMSNALVHRVVPSAVGLGLPVREARLTPGQIFHDVVTGSTIEHDVLDASPVALGSYTLHRAFQPVEVLKEIVITETVGADFTDFPRAHLWPLDVVELRSS